MLPLTYPAAISAKGDFAAYHARQLADPINAWHDIPGGTCCTFHGMNTREARESYAQSVQSGMAEHVAKGHYSQEWAMSATFSDILAGNNGD